ncbi:L-histidine N(alpha)-methyltransferase [Mucilaginibacter sabulilitoris]|uniref:L-histidine N(Alpha)-methyltransferase n=1 Tax=Mucilaginibacter sabulilitoris TaxID=1173583 RepID=A0ABZ0TVZ4_9SPHI|nr:L-histidine N(alpha)-methyltransferase [Mucilaginibacter sabulilitoris]WPU96936.1 L-histidine N(alpha)-methyltransferase [Mucilaginibacter sabulilitoris]
MFVLTEKENIIAQFTQDVIAGLSMTPKRLPSKYFYDAKGDGLFRDIMACKDYYVTRCEMEIFTEQTEKIARAISTGRGEFDLIELGPGDCSKSKHLLQALLNNGVRFNYVPIDISYDVIQGIESNLPGDLPGIQISSRHGDYHQMLKALSSGSDSRKVILNLGANVGNMPSEQCYKFIGDLRNSLSKGDIVLMGFDLVKDPKIIRAAYDDDEGITREFNLNLLRRMSNELEADLDISKFEHYCSYDPVTGACKSYLVAVGDTSIDIGAERFKLSRYESIWTEISQKYTLAQIEDIALANAFQPINLFTDSREWFADVLWEAK